MSHNLGQPSDARIGKTSRSGRNGGYSSDGDSIYDSVESRLRYEAYSRLQASAVAFGEKLPIPEIVAIGGQSDGKSSLLEALLGFRFNVREVEMGTRRPLILQMVHDPTALEPRCRLQEEDSEDYGQFIDPPSAVAEAVRSRTDAHLRQLGPGVAVSPKPIIMRAEYAYSPNLTIIDSPGFVLNARKGESESTPESIMSMVKSLVSPPHRLILFLQQSSVEWVSSLWLDVVKEVDPTFRRTVIVSSKFDNRLKEFAERWEVDRYLSANGVLGEGVRPFFVALPKDRTIASNSEFRRQISAVDADILRQLREGVTGGFDEERFGEQIGFGNLRRFLEQELQRRYRDAAPATLALLERRCAEVDSDLELAEAKLATAGDIAGLRKAAMIHSAAVSRHIIALIDGSADPDPEAWGRTSEEEREESGVGRWPGVSVEVKTVNGNLRLYGGAAFERVLDEFRTAACSIECPLVSREKVANILLAHGGKQGGPMAAAAEIARQSVRTILSPLLDALCDRLAHVLRWLFDVSLHRLTAEVEADSGPSEARTAVSTLDAYVAFHASLRQAHHRFVSDLAGQCKDRARHHLATVTSPFSATDSWEITLTAPQMAPFGDVYFPVDDSAATAAGYSLNAEAGPSTNHRTSLDDPENLLKQNLRSTGGSPPPDDVADLQRDGHTVPETPSPDQGITDVAAIKRRDFATAAGRSNLVNGQQQSGAMAPGGDLSGILKRFNASNMDAPPAVQKKRNGAVLNGNGAGIPRWPSARLANAKGPPGRGGSAYVDVCLMVAETFSRIREILVNRMVPTAMSSGFLTPCRESLSTAVSLDLFAVTDDEFMDMFVAPGAIEYLRNAKSSLEKRSETLQHCMREFRNLARSL